MCASIDIFKTKAGILFKTNPTKHWYGLALTGCHFVALIGCVLMGINALNVFLFYVFLFIYDYNYLLRDGKWKLAFG